MNNTGKLATIQGCLLGIAIGDALGMPVETMRYTEILSETNNRGITDFIDPLSKREWLKDLRAGDTTDDWQLTRAVAVSLIRTQGTFDILDCAAEHILEHNRSTFGWGKTTETAIQAILKEERILLKDSLPPAAPGKGCGNGIIMKVAPLAICNNLFQGSEEKLWHDVKSLGSITHPDIRASIAAYATALFLNLVLEYTILDTEDGLDYLRSVIEKVAMIEASENITTDLVSEKLILVLTNVQSVENLRNAVGCGFHALQTVAFTIGTFIRHPRDFRTGILEAANAGGDTDTNASIVGGLIGGNVGFLHIPREWREFSVCFQESLDLGEKLFALQKG